MYFVRMDKKILGENLSKQNQEDIMRVKKNGEVTVYAISGTHVVFLGLNMQVENTNDLMGFAIQRQDKETGEVVWLRGNKTFEKCNAGSTVTDYSSLVAPIQGFQWADYTAKPGYTYIYRIYPMRGEPGKLQKGSLTEVEISTEKPFGEKISVFFNMGAIASQAYTKKFGREKPSKVGDAAYQWLERGLLDGFESFIKRAENKDYSLHCAFYEFNLPKILQMFAEAVARKVSVEIIYDAEPNASGTQKTKQAIHEGKLDPYCFPRINAPVMHNKFVVLSHLGKPIAAWTGSMNASENAVYGQLNNGIIVEDPVLAQQYLNYWMELKKDDEHKVMQEWVETNNVFPLEEKADSIPVIFSPHKGTKTEDRVLEWYKSTASSATEALFMTFPFGILDGFAKVFDHEDSVLRFAMLDKYPSCGRNSKEAKAEIDRIRKFPNICMAVGDYIKVKTIDGWLEERFSLGSGVPWVHTKFMLVDPLGTKPTVISGSANWSDESTHGNDENMLIIRNDLTVADIYFTEFMRIFSHHRFREAVKIYTEEDKSNKADNWNRNI